MYKKTLLFVYALLIACVTTANAQANLPMDDESKLISYKKVVDLPATSKTELYNRAFAWANSFYKNPGNVIREKDTVAGKIVCVARFKIYHKAEKKNETVTDAGDVQYTLTINFKDDKYRYTLTNIGWQQKSAFPAEKWLDKKNQYYSIAWDYYLEQTDAKAKEILAALEKALGTPPKVKKDDW